MGGILEAPVLKTCFECGRALPSRLRKFCSNDCNLAFHGGSPPRLAALALARASGQDPSQTESAGRRRAESNSRNAAAER